jgi:hypothetical protein
MKVKILGCLIWMEVGCKLSMARKEPREDWKLERAWEGSVNIRSKLSLAGVG